MTDQPTGRDPLSDDADRSDPTAAAGQFDDHATEVIRPGDRSLLDAGAADSTEVIRPGQPAPESTRLLDQPETRLLAQPETRQMQSPFPASGFGAPSGGPQPPMGGYPDPYSQPPGGYADPYPQPYAQAQRDPYAGTPYPSVDPYGTADPSAPQVSQAYGAAAPPPVYPPPAQIAPPPPTYAPPPAGYVAPPPYAVPQHYSYGAPPPGTIAPTNGSAIAVTISSAVSLLLCCNVFSVISLIMGIVAMSKQTADPNGSRSLAKAAWWVFGIGMGLVVLGGIAYLVLIAAGVIASDPTYDSTY